MKLISMSKALEILGGTTSMRGDKFAEQYGLTLIETDIKHGNGLTRLFDEAEVIAAKERIGDLPKRRRGRPRKGDKWIPRESHEEHLLRVEKKIDLILSSFCISFNE